jgi:hypothetical protein
MRVNPRVISQSIEDETILIHLDTEQVYALNRTASRLWTLLERGYPVDEIRAQLFEEFDVDHEQLMQEIDTLIPELVREGLILTDE